MVFPEVVQVMYVLERQHQIVVFRLGVRVRYDAHKLVLVEDQVRVTYGSDQIVVLHMSHREPKQNDIVSKGPGPA